MSAVVRLEATAPGEEEVAGVAAINAAGVTPAIVAPEACKIFPELIEPTVNPLTLTTLGLGKFPVKSPPAT
jgi:hypothetical protein